MAIRDTLRANAAPHLQQGEVIEAVIAAQTTSQWLSLLSYWIINKRFHKDIAAADDRAS